ncbi:MAG TPA: molybdopterin-dependent oxidoreductase [Actinocrinis sp.]|nr:molybdopterin-dependent oxidoreductase [Actinocrinis sp.]
MTPPASTDAPGTAPGVRTTPPPGQAASAPTTTSSTSHWGAYLVRKDADGAIAVLPHPADPAPSPLLGNVADSLRHRTRVRRPAVRRGWLQNGPGPTDRRGREPFVEVEWDEALDLLAAELTRVRAEHGDESVFGGSYGWASAGRFHHAQSQLHRFLNLGGGFTASRNSYSLGTSLVLLPHLVGDADAVLRAGSSWPTLIEHTELIVAFGGIPAKNVFVTPGGVTKHVTPGALADLAARGVGVALISPLRADLPDDVDAEWYPVTPATDVALMLGLAHTLLAEGLQDQAFLDRYTVGAAEFADYLHGKADGVAKDADWAAAICGIGAERIRALARRMAASRTLIAVTWSLQRIQHGEQPVWAGLALAAMLGQIGLPGGGFGHGYGSMGDVGDHGPQIRLPYLSQGENPVRTFIPVARISDMLLNPGAEYDYDGTRYTYPDIRLVYWAGGNPFHHHQDLGRLRRAFARPDTIVVHEPYWTSSARQADIVLPSTTTLEREDLGGGRRDTHLIAMQRAVDPVGEARDDYTILAGLANRLGYAQEFTEGRTAREWLEHLYTDWREQLLREGYAGREVRDVPTFADFWQTGEYVLPPGRSHFTLFEEFRADPEGAPLKTPSGRIELVSETVRGFGYPDCPGHPVWLEPDEWPGSPDAARYPLHLIANQPSTRLHSQLDVGAVSRASKVAGREAVRMHPQDAIARGIRDGDVVRIFNDRGACLAGAVLVEAARPGVVQLPTGAWFDPLEPDGGDAGDGAVPFCVHGNPNVLTADVPSSRLSQGCTGQHALVQVERLVGEPPPVTVTSPPDLLPKGRPMSTDTHARTDSSPLAASLATLPAPAPNRLRATAESLAERAEEHDRDGSFPFEGVAEVHAAGLLTATVAERYGGPGTGLAGTVEILRVLGSADPSVALVTAMTLFTHAAQARTNSWPDRHYRQLLADSAEAPALVNALRVEPELGTPARGGLPATTARADADGWSLTGHKIFSTGAVGLRWLAVWAKTDEDPTRVGSFLVRRPEPAVAPDGLTIEPTWDHLGLRASRSDDVHLAGVRVPLDATSGLVDPSAGDPRRDPDLVAWNNLGLTALYLGVAESARDWLIDFLHQRTPAALGKPLATLPRFQDGVGEIEAQLTAALDLIAGLALRYDAGDRQAAEHSAAAKLIGTRAAINAVERATSLIGNNALTRRNPLERHHRDVLCARVHTPQDDSIVSSVGQAAIARRAPKPAA